MTAFETNMDQFIKERMMEYLRDQGYNFYQSATLLKLSQEERNTLSRTWAE
jgi:hypothetical protein